MCSSSTCVTGPRASKVTRRRVAAGGIDLVSRLAPRDFDESRAIDANEVAADQDAVDVDREDSTVFRFEASHVAHPTNEELGPHEVVEDLVGQSLDVDGRPERLAHRFFSISSLSAASRGAQKPSTKAATGAKPSGLIE